MNVGRSGALRGRELSKRNSITGVPNNTMNWASKEEECMKLAREGQAHISQKDQANGIECLERALAVGTSDLNVLSVIYCLLGNAHFALNNFDKALHYHNQDLLLSKARSDLSSEAKTCGHLATIWKKKNDHDKAIPCLERQLNIAKEQGDKKTELTAIYNLGMNHYARAKQLKDQLKATNLDISVLGMNTSLKQPVISDLEKCVEFFNSILQMSDEVSDEGMLGRSNYHLGNTYHLLQDFEKSIENHKKGLDIFKRLANKPAQRRSYINMGNSYLCLPRIEKAMEYYRLAHSLACDLRDQLTEAECYSLLAHALTLIPDFKTASEYHIRHLEIVRALHDKAGEAMAYSSLGNDFKCLSDFPKAAYFFARNRKVAKALEDVVMAQTATESLRSMLMDRQIEVVEGEIFLDSSADPEGFPLRLSGSLRSLDSLKMDGSDVSNTSRASTESKIPKGGTKYTPDEFFALVSKMQGSRLDEQRCLPPVFHGPTLVPNNSTASLNKNDPFNISPVKEEQSSSSKRRRSLIGRLKNFNPLSTSTPLIGRFSSLSSLKSNPHSRKGSRANSPGRNSLVSLTEENNRGPVPFMDLSSVSAVPNDLSDDGLFRIPDLPKKTTQSAVNLSLGQNMSSFDDSLHDNENKENNGNDKGNQRTNTPKAPPRKRTAGDGSQSLLDLLVASNSYRFDDQRCAPPVLKDKSQLRNSLNMADGDLSKSKGETAHESKVDEDEIDALVSHLENGRIDEQRT